MHEDRRAAAERFADRALPTSALEEWRYSRIDALDLDRYQPALTAGLPPPGSGAEVEDLLGAVGAGGTGRTGMTVIETRDGYLTSQPGTQPGVTVERISGPEALPVGLGEIAGEPDSFAALNRAFAPDPLRIRVARGAQAGPVVVVHRADQDRAAVFPRVLVEAGELAEVQVVELVVGRAAALVVPVTELDVGAGAHLSYLQVQLLGPAAWQIGLQGSRVAKDGVLVSAAVALGGDYARLRTDSALTGTGAEGRLLAMYFSAGHQMHDFRTVQHHRVPKTRSDLLYKGAVANSARSVYSGLIRVDKGAKGTHAMQTNRNLVLHEGAHADSVPNLEIEDNDVHCSHASAVGPIAEDQRFYLETRGVPSEVADRLITLGFLDEVLEQLPVPALAGSLRTMVARKLQVADAAEWAGSGRPAAGGRAPGGN